MAVEILIVLYFQVAKHQVANHMARLMLVINWLNNELEGTSGSQLVLAFACGVTYIKPITKSAFLLISC